MDGTVKNPGRPTNSYAVSPVHFRTSPKCSKNHGRSLCCEACDLLLRAPGDSVNVGRAFALAEGLPTDACIYLYWSVLARHKFQLIIKSRSLNQIEGTGRQLSWQITKDVVLLDFFEVLFWNLPPKMDEWAFSLFSRARVLRLSPIDTKRVDSNMPRIVPTAWVEGSKKTRLYSFGGTQDVPELFFFFVSFECTCNTESENSIWCIHLLSIRCRTVSWSFQQGGSKSEVS